MKKCVFGGTFDPIHNAHLAMAEAAKKAFGLDQVLFMTAGDPYFKTSEKRITPAAMRLEMTRLAMEGHEGFAASDMEANREGHTYTCDTLTELAAAEPETEWYFMIGADCVESIARWYRPDIIFSIATVSGANRNDQIPREQLDATAEKLRKEFGARILILDWEGADVSSSGVRERIECGDYGVPVPDKVLAYVKAHDLYQQQVDEEAIIAELRQTLKPSRFLHTLGVAETAVELAKIYGESPRRARIAGLLHDCAKPEADALGHGPMGALKAKEHFGIRDQGILDAIRTHTTGEAAMPLLSKIIYTADYIEPNRTRLQRLPELREEAKRDLDLAVYHISEDTLNYLRQKGGVIDSKTLDVYNYYKSKIKDR